MLLAIFDKAIESEDARRNKVMRFEEVEILRRSVNTQDVGGLAQVPAYLMICAELNILAPLFLFFDKSCG